MKNVIAIFLLLAITACNSQEKGKEKEDSKEEKKETGVKPKEKWDVRKEYDGYGNLIKYDSIYSWSYSNVEGDSIRVNLDSIMDNFRRYFKDTSPFTWDDYFSYFPKEDSLMTQDFFRGDYFFKNWKRQHNQFEKMIRQMDSTRNEFLKKFHPGLIESKENYKKI